MSIDTASKSCIHHGRNVKRLREMLGIKQESVAIDLNITQQAISELEQREIIPDAMLEKIATILHIPVEAIKNMSEESTINYINTFNDKVSSSFLNNSINCTFNPIEKIVELYEEKIVLYERMLKDRDLLLEKFSNK